MIKMEKTGLSALKHEYEKKRKKYNLPTFSKLNETFDIEKIADKETDFLVREIRRVISEKAAHILRFFELFLNPAGAPLFIMSALKDMDSSVGQVIEKIYKELTELEINSLELDLDYSEKNEAKFINNVMKEWSKFQNSIKIVTNELRKAIHSENSRKKGYFG